MPTDFLRCAVGFASCDPGGPSSASSELGAPASARKRILRIGITGSLASGKSTALRYFEERGYPVIDADRIARDLVEPGTEALARIVDRFGDSILNEGRLDRKRLGSVVFSDSSALEDLNAILHPRIRTAFSEEVRRLERKGAELVFSEIPLLFESGFEDFFDVVLTIVASEHLLLDRAVRRDGISSDHARGILRNQLPDEIKAQRSHFVIRNDGSLEDFERSLGEFLGRCRRMLSPE